jgi:hypothetical protein
MTDKKEIIIDGIDVSECEYRDWRNFCRCDNSKENEGEERSTGKGGCEYNPNCYFKQLARAKDKINYMEEDIKIVENARNDLERELKRKEQELQEAMDNYVKLDNQRVKEYNELVDKYNNKEQEIGNICKAFDIEYGIDEETGNLIGRCNKLYKKEQECEKLKIKLNPKLKNAPCVYYEGQTGLCKAKEFVKCNPVNCKLYTIDELSTIVDLQEQLKRKEQECEDLKEQLNQAKYLSEGAL